MTNEEVEEAQIIEVEEEVTLDESQPAEISLDTSDGNNEPQGLSEEDLDKRREKTQKRINKLVAQRKESEEREAAAMQFAQQQKNEVDALRGQLSNLNTGYSSEASSRIDSQEIQAKTAFKEAYEAGEVDKMADAQQVMAKIAIEKERLRIFKDNQEKQKQRAVQVQEQQIQQQAQPQQQVQQEPDAKAVDWAEREENSWFGQDRAMTATAFTIHQQLVEEEGLDETLCDKEAKYKKYTLDEINNLTVKELQDIARKNKLKIRGKKEELIERVKTLYNLNIIMN